MISGIKEQNNTSMFQIHKFIETMNKNIQICQLSMTFSFFQTWWNYGDFKSNEINYGRTTWHLLKHTTVDVFFLWDYIYRMCKN